MAARMGSAKSVTHPGTGVAVMVGRGEGVTDGVGVLVSEGVKVGINVSVETTGVRVGVSRGKNVLHPTKSDENNIAAITL